MERLAHDHALAQRLAQGLQGIAGISVKSAQTNIVFADVAGGRAPALLAYLQTQGVLATGLIGLRFVTHLHITEADIDAALAAIRSFFDLGAAPASAAGSGPY